MPRLIGYHAYTKDGKGFIVNHEGAVCSEKPFLDWLINDCAEEEGHRKVAYDVDAFAAVVCRLADLSEAEATKLVDTTKLHIPPYDMAYFSGKYFSVSKGTGWGRPYAGFYDGGQYLDGPGIEDRDDVEYAIAKANEARDIGAKASQTYHKFGWDGSALTSPIKSLEKSVLKGLNPPVHSDNPPEVNQIALQCCKGPWVEAFKLGAWEEAYDYDLASAYPFILAQLLDLRRGDWVLTPEKPEGAVYGFLDGTVNITKSFSPVLWNDPDEAADYSYTPTGPWPTQLTAHMVDFIREWGIGDFETNRGWWWIPGAAVAYTPMKGIIEWLYQKRQTADAFETKLLKRGMAAMWGRLLSVYADRYGPQFNPPWAAYVEDMTKTAVARYVLENKLTPIHIAVDGVICPENIDLPGGGMGTWRKSHAGGVIVVSSGIAAVEGKAGAEDFSLKYPWLKEMITENPDASEYVMHKSAVCTLGKALQTDFSKLGEVEEITRSIAIGGDPKRLYFDAPETGGDLLAGTWDSEPMDVSVIMGQESRV